MDNALTIINALITELGDVTLGQAKSWLEVEDNADKLLKEGHEDEGGE